MILLSKNARNGLLIIVALVLVTAIYPILFAFLPSFRGLFETKSHELLNSDWYIPTFVIHISFGTVALISGSTQFFNEIRKKKLNIHRVLGKIYVFAVMPTGITGLIVGFHATGTWYSKAGFIGSAVGLLTTTVLAFIKIRKGNIEQHQKWMIRSYAFCFSFVTFRVYLALGYAIGLWFGMFYSYLSFLSWVPNLIFVEWRMKRRKHNSPI